MARESASKVAFTCKDQAEKALASIGVSIRNVKTQELRSFVEIMRDLNAVWGDLAETTKNRVAVSVTALV